MPKDFSLELAEHTLEYIDDDHTYLVDGVIVPSISACLSFLFGNPYPRVRKDVLERKAARGNMIHEGIEKFCKTGNMSGIEEVRNFRFLSRIYGLIPVENEVPVILFGANGPLAAGRLDLVLSVGGALEISDIKTTASLDRHRLGGQLNLYRHAYQQTYGKEISSLSGIHLPDEEKRKYVRIPISPEWTLDAIQKLEAHYDKHNDGQTA